MTVTAALIYIANEQALIDWLTENLPDTVHENGSARVEAGIARTASYPNPGVANDGPAGLYANLTPEQVAQWTALAAIPALGITILGQTPYVGIDTGTILYDKVSKDNYAWSLWLDVATIPEMEVEDELGGGTIVLPSSVAKPRVQ